MPRRELLSAVQREALVAVPTSTEEIALHYTLNESDLALIRRRRGAHNQLGFAAQLCYLRYPGIQLTFGMEPPVVLLKYIGQQLRIKSAVCVEYASRDETRREHALELQQAFGYRSFTVADYRHARTWLTELALQTNSAVMPVASAHDPAVHDDRRPVHPSDAGKTDAYLARVLQRIAGRSCVLSATRSAVSAVRRRVAAPA